MVLAALCPLCLCAQGIADVVSALRDMGCFKAGATFTATLPQKADDVIYTLALTSMATPADTLAPCAYLIDWSLPTPSGKSEGFSAYFDGNHYRYRDMRLQEYHYSWDSVPFRAAGNQKGVQLTAQFADLLPQVMAAQIAEMQASPLYRLTMLPQRTLNGRKAVGIEAVMTVRGEEIMEREYLFDAQTFAPLRVHTESNPGRITEQVITVNYSPEPAPRCTPLSEERLMELYPTVFEKYRLSNFRIENLPGTPLPPFALPTPTGERYTYHRGQGFAAPAVIVLMDPTVGFNAETVASVRRAADSLERPADVIWAVTTTNAELASAPVGELRQGESLLMNARSLARDCGAASLPAIVVTDSKGVVKNVSLGFNNSIEDFVIQAVTLCK